MNSSCGSTASFCRGQGGLVIRTCSPLRSCTGSALPHGALASCDQGRGLRTPPRALPRNPHRFAQGGDGWMSCYAPPCCASRSPRGQRSPIGTCLTLVELLVRIHSWVYRRWTLLFHKMYPDGPYATKSFADGPYAHYFRADGPYFLKPLLRWTLRH